MHLKLLRLVALLLTATWLAGCETPPPQAPRSAYAPVNPLQVDVRNGRVTLRASDVQLHDLLIEIARQSELEILLQGKLQERVSLAFHDQPLSAAIGRILQDHSFALHYLSRQTGADESPPNRLWVFASEISTSGALEAPATPAPTPQTDPAASLIFALAHEDDEVRLNAVATFTRLDNGRIPPVLANAALQDWKPAVRAAALDVLGELGGHEALPSLEQALYDPSGEVREAAVSAIADIGGHDAIPALAAALNNRDPQVREEAVDALGEIGGGTVVTLLQQALMDEARSVREAAAEYLAGQNDP